MAVGGLVLTGAHVVCRVNGRVIGRVTSIRWGRQRQVRRAQGIDMLTPSELIPGPEVITVTMGLVATRRDGLAEGAGMVPPTRDIAREQYVALELRDRISDTVIRQFDAALLSSEEWNAVVRDVLRGTVTFECLGGLGQIRPRGA